MAKFNWDKTRYENTAASHGSEGFASDSLPSGYARGGSKFSPQIVQCSHCKNNFTVGLLPNHLFNCRALKGKSHKVSSLKLEHPLKGAKVIPLVRKKT